MPTLSVLATRIEKSKKKKKKKQKLMNQNEPLEEKFGHKLMCSQRVESEKGWMNRV